MRKTGADCRCSDETVPLVRAVASSCALCAAASAELIPLHGNSLRRFARPDPSWFGTEHHGDVGERPAQRRPHFVPTSGGTCGTWPTASRATRRTAWLWNASSRLSTARVVPQSWSWSPSTRRTKRARCELAQRLQRLLREPLVGLRERFVEHQLRKPICCRHFRDRPG